MLNAEEVKAAKKAKAKEAKAGKVAAVKQVEKGKVGQVRTSSRKAKITTDQGNNEGEVEFPPAGGKDYVRLDQIRLIRPALILEEARVVASNCSDKEQNEEETVGNNLILQRAKDAHNALYERFRQKVGEQDIEEYCKLKSELIG